MEIRTKVLTATQWNTEIDNLICFLQDKGKQALSVSYGWDCDLDMEDLYQEVPLPLSDLRAWLAQSIEAGIFIFGESNLHVQSADREIEIELCHERDIHLATDNKELAQQVASEWARRGFAPYEVGLEK